MKANNRSKSFAQKSNTPQTTIIDYAIRMLRPLARLNRDKGQKQNRFVVKLLENISLTSNPRTAQPKMNMR